MTPYYDEDGITIYHADCRDVLPSLSGIDLVFTSPPYNMGVSTGGKDRPGRWPAARKIANGYLSHSDAMPRSEYDEWQTWTVRTLWETLNATGAIFYNHKPRIQNGVAFLPTEYGVGLPLRQVIIWDRGTGLNFNHMFFLPKHEWIIVWAKAGFRLKDQHASQIGDVWRVMPEVRGDHPAPFPVALPLMAIGATDATTILDPFMGIGTVLRAARDLGRKAIGIEIEERYCEIAVQRLAQGVLAL